MRICWNIVSDPAFLTLALVVVTIAYVVVTYRILKANQRVVTVMKEQLEASLRPYIVVSTFITPGNPMICLRISNTGRTTAENLKLRWDKDFYQYREKEDKYNLRKAYAFQNVIETFVPGAELLFYLGMGFQIFADDTDPKLTPSQFTITATYRYSGKEILEQTTIDLEAYRKTSLPPQDAIVSELKEIAKAVDALSRAFRNS
jgi:hypothetical protein